MPTPSPRRQNSDPHSSSRTLSSPPYTRPSSIGSPPHSSSSSVASASSYAISTTSSAYRHHSASVLPQTPFESPKSKLYSDSKHNPKTRGSVGLLVVGLSGKSSTTLVAGILANRLGMKWRGPKGEPKTANYSSCLTQQIASQNKHGNVAGFADEIKGLANVSMAAIGGWDIVPRKLGDSLMDAQLLDYDLVKQVKDEMNKIKVFRGYSLDESCTHVLSSKEAPNASEVLKCLRADIRYFKWRNGVVGHTTVVWHATTENDFDYDFLTDVSTARDLLNCIEAHEKLPPSLLYATAALLEGCSFCNGKSQRTLQCPGLLDLARQQVGVYCLGSSFNIDLTGAAIVQGLQAVLGMETHVSTLSSKDPEKVKSRDDDDAILIGDKMTNLIQKTTQVVEYNSVGFLGEMQTLVTCTTKNDALVCAPLLMDVAVWCDLFSSKSWPHEKVSMALSYLFREPLQANTMTLARQMQELATQANVACNSKKKPRSEKKKRVRIRPEEKATEWAIPHDACIVCAGLACVDMQLHQATGGHGGESIETFEGAKSIGGGSVSMACKTLARLCHGAQLDDDYMQVTPPVVHSVVPLCKIGNDDSGNKLLDLLEDCGGACRNVETKHIRQARQDDDTARTALAVLPIYRDGRRGCYFDAASNATFSQSEMMKLIHGLVPTVDVSPPSDYGADNYKESVQESGPVYGAFLFGYPHLLPKMQGEALANILCDAQTVMEEGGTVALDLNGVPETALRKNGASGMRTVAELKQDPVIGAALPYVDILHMNEDELVLLTGCEIEGSDSSQQQDELAISAAINLFLLCGVGIVAVTRGKKGSFVCCNNEDRFKKSPLLPASWTDCTATISAVDLPRDTVINTNGAGDSFTAGLLVASMLRHTGMSVPVQKDTDHDGSEGEKSLDMDELNAKSPPSTPSRPANPTSPKAKLSPYTLYMRENYVNLKQQLNDDKRAIFSKCHELWESESEDVKAMYERRAAEEEAEEENETSVRLDNELDALDSTTPRKEATPKSPSTEGTEAKIRSLYMTNRALNLESAVQFASLVAAHHVDVSTRDLMHLDMSRLLERAMIFPHGLQEI